MKKKDHSGLVEVSKLPAIGAATLDAISGCSVAAPP
jgi:hypothetical protein